MNKLLMFLYLLILIISVNNYIVNSQLTRSANINRDCLEEFYDQFDNLDDAVVIDNSTVSIENNRILIVGDSQACAVGMYADDKAWRIKNHLGNPSDVIGVWCKVSSTIDYWSVKGRLQQAIHDFNPNIIVIFLGTNHYSAKHAPNVKPILDLIQENNLRCVWVGNTLVKGQHWAINNLLRDVVTPTCTYFDTEASNVVLIDGIHPGPSASQQWLKDVWSKIRLNPDEEICK